jgi:hypothetical protein
VFCLNKCVHNCTVITINITIIIIIIIIIINIIIRRGLLRLIGGHTHHASLHKRKCFLGAATQQLQFAAAAN